MIPGRRYPAGAGPVSYAWRDPAWLTPLRAAALDARTRPEPPPRRASSSQMPRIASAAARRDFADSRAAGLTVARAAAAAGVQRRTGQWWEHLRLAGSLL